MISTSNSLGWIWTMRRRETTQISIRFPISSRCRIRMRTRRIDIAGNRSRISSWRRIENYRTN